MAVIPSQNVAYFLRQRFHSAVVASVRAQLQLLAQIQGLKCTVLDLLVKASAATVSLEWYIITLTVQYLLGHRQANALLMSCLGLACYVGCYLKDALCGPRPYHLLPESRIKHHTAGTPDGGGVAEDCRTSNNRSDSRERSSNSKDILLHVYGKTEPEFGAPSLHTLMALVMTGYASTLLSSWARRTSFQTAHTNDSTDGSSSLDIDIAINHASGENMAFFRAVLVATPPSALLILAVAWSAWIGFGRMYFGVHSLTDVVSSAVVGVPLLLFWEVCGPWWLTWMTGSGLAGVLVMLAIHAVMLGVYPQPPIHTSSYQDAVVFTGAVMGLSINLALGEGKFLTFIRNKLAQGFIGTPEYPTSLLVYMAGLIQHYYVEWVAIKCVVGVTAVVIAIKVTKKLVLKVGPQLMDLVPLHVRARLQPPVSVDYRNISVLYELGASGNAHDGRDHDYSSSMHGLNPDSTGNPVLRQRHQQSSSHTSQLPNGKYFSNVSVEDIMDKSTKSGKVLLRPDGVPWDVDVLRRYLCYTAASFTLGQFALLMERVEQVAEHTTAMT